MRNENFFFFYERNEKVRARQAESCITSARASSPVRRSSYGLPAALSVCASSLSLSFHVCSASIVLSFFTYLLFWLFFSCFSPSNEEINLLRSEGIAALCYSKSNLSISIEVLLYVQISKQMNSNDPICFSSWRTDFSLIEFFNNNELT